MTFGEAMSDLKTMIDHVDELERQKHQVSTAVALDVLNQLEAMVRVNAEERAEAVKAL